MFFNKTLDKYMSQKVTDVKFCKKCVVSNQRPRINLDEDGVCSACRFAHQKHNKIDWASREKDLIELLDQYRSKDGSYDCIVPVSGGKDSGYVAHQLKFKYGMHPLTVTWAPFLYTDIGWQNYISFKDTGFDNVLCFPNGKIHRKLSRLSFELVGDAWEPFAYGQKAYAFQIAVKFKIPLIFYGESGEVEYGGSVKNIDKPSEGITDWKNFYYKGSSLDEIAKHGLECGFLTEEEVKDKSFEFYNPPNMEEVEKIGAQMHWFSFYKKWVPQENYYYAVEHLAFQANPGRSEGTYSKYASLDDKTDGFHYYLGYIKHGLGRTTSDAAHEIRDGHLTREEGVALVQRYDGEFPKKYFKEFLEYLEIDEYQFNEVIDFYRNMSPHLWKKEDGVWKLTHQVTDLNVKREKIEVQPEVKSVEVKASNEKIFSKHGLPEKVIFCKSCVMSNQRPASSVEFKHKVTHKHRALRINDEGICDACQYARQKDKIQWKKREDELLQLLDKHRRTDGQYDCIVPGSGGKDSCYASHILKYKYGMHPLTITWPPILYTDIGYKNFRNWISVGGFDNISFNYNGKNHALLTKLAIQNLLHPFQPFILGQKNLAPKIAIKYDVPLIFYGENEAEYGNPIADNVSSMRDKSYYTMSNLDEVFLGGVSVKELMEKYGLSYHDVQTYLPADHQEIQRSKTEVHYLGYYLKWTPQESYYYAVEHTGFEANPVRTEGTYSKYNSLDDKIDGLHYYTTFVKFGLGRATYDASQEIRNKHLTREEGMALVKRFDGEFPERYFKEVMDFIGMSEDEFRNNCDRFRSPHLWEKQAGSWKLRNSIYEQSDQLVLG